MNSTDDYSDLDSVDTDFEEQPARDLVDLVLEGDVKFYRKLLPEIRKLDSDSFKNMFQGNKDYDYHIKNKHNFNELLKKFENFKYLLEEWYEDKDTHIYIKELWQKYISIESLRDKTEKEIEDFLFKNNIEYKSWPERIKNQFLNIIRNTKNTLIFACKKSYEKLPKSIKNLLDKLYSISIYYKKKGNELFSKLSNNQFFIVAKKFLNIDLENSGFLLSTIIGIISQRQEKAIDYLFDIGDNLFEFFTLNNFTKNINGQFIASALYSVFSLYNLYYSYENCKMIKAELEKIKVYEDKINEIDIKFEEHKKMIESLSESDIHDINIYNLKLEQCVESIREDKEKIANLIKEIKARIEEKIRQKNSKITDMIFLGLKVGIGIAGAIATKGSSCALNTISTAANGISMIFDGIDIKNLIEMVEKLEKALEKAENIERKIDDELKKQIQRLNENKDAAPTFC